MRWPWVVVLLVFAVGVLAPACGGEPAPVITEAMIREALLAAEDFPSNWDRTNVVVIEDESQLGRADFRFNFCQPDPMPKERPERSEPQIYASALFERPGSLLPFGDEIIIVRDDAQAVFTYFDELVELCEAQQPDHSWDYFRLPFPALGDESLALRIRPKPGTPNYEEGWPDQHQVLIRKGDALIGLVYRDEPATDVATTEALARRALARFEEAIEKQ
jgi:hypothetical protein